MGHDTISNRIVKKSKWLIGSTCERGSQFPQSRYRNNLRMKKLEAGRHPLSAVVRAVNRIPNMTVLN